MAGVYSVSVTNSNSCSNSATTSVVVYPKPSITIASNSPVCEGNTISLSASGGTSYSWSGYAAFASTQQNPSQASATTSMAGVYSVSVTNSNSCSNSATTSVVVYPKPSITIASNSPVCEGTTISLSASGGTTYSWAGRNFSSSLQNPSQASATTSMAGVYSVSVTNSNSCSNSATTSVVVNPKPSITIASNSPVCEGNTISLSASGGTSYSWSLPLPLLRLFASTQQNPSQASQVLLLVYGGVFIRSR
ncbi:MAG: hypothetical protein U0Y10_26710 [Spirosomataceae bacterium]